MFDTYKQKRNANNAHKYDCSSPRNKQQQEEEKRKVKGDKRDWIQQTQRDNLTIRLK